MKKSIYKKLIALIFVQFMAAFSLSIHAQEGSGVATTSIAKSSETAEVIIYRLLDGRDTSLAAYINGHVVGILLPGTHTQANVCKGTFDLRLRGRKNTNFDGAQQFDTKTGNLVYYRVNPSDARYTVERVEAAQAVQELQNSQPSSVISRVPSPVCTQPVRVVNLGADVMFVTGSAQISTAGVSQLQRFATDIKRQLNQIDSFKVIGHTDAMGTDAYNDALSLARAKSVVQYFERQGISVPMSVEGRGERQPITTGCERYKKDLKKMIACLQPDRRVVIEITGKQ